MESLFTCAVPVTVHVPAAQLQGFPAGAPLTEQMSDTCVGGRVVVVVLVVVVVVLVVAVVLVVVEVL
ncbi:MAG TPA: hypothetical protein VKW76_09415, partial [Candidatus Binatia bacterium]|nr:hypothetical protein [Candidatus Binatia bacterium]